MKGKYCSFLRPLGKVIAKNHCEDFLNKDQSLSSKQFHWHEIVSVKNRRQMANSSIPDKFLTANTHDVCNILLAKKVIVLVTCS